MEGLYNHCGARTISRPELYAMPEPECLGPTHQPVHHGDYLQMVDGVLDDYGLTVADEGYGLTKDGLDLFGVMRVEGQDLAVHEGVGFTIGLRGSNGGRLKRGFASGSQVFVCDNLAFSGDIIFGTKHTTYILDRLRTMMTEAVRRFAGSTHQQVAQIESYKMAQITDQTADSAMVAMLRRGIVGPQRLPRIIEEWYEPSHEEHAEDGRTVWRLMNAATEGLRTRPGGPSQLPHLPPRTIALHKLCDELAHAA